MKTYYLFAFISCLGFYACNSTNSKTSKMVYTVDQLTETAYGKVGDTLSVSGFCADICQTGDWIVLQGTDTTRAIQAVANKHLTAFNRDVKYNNLTVEGILHEKRVDSLFLIEWETRLDESLKGLNGNPTAVAQIKKQIAQIYEAIGENHKKRGLNYWSQFTLEVSEYAVNK